LNRGINDFKNGYQTRTNIVKDKKVNMVTDSHIILARWRNHFCKLLNVRWDNDGRQMEIHTAEPLMPESSAFEVEMVTEKLKRHKSPGSDQTSAKLIKSRGRKILCEIHKLINSVWNKEELPKQWKELIIVPIYTGVLISP
jgi:hypothetical protein